jgi:glycosyltransferase involved in cell wall biosynthesis
MKVSVIIPCYNTAAYVGQTLESVFAQTYRDYEVAVVNDGSPDTPQLEAVLETWQDRITYIKTSNQGVAAARNTGIRATRSHLIAFLDSDDYWHPDYLSSQVQAMAELDADIVYPNAVVFYDSPEVQSPRLMTEMVPLQGNVTVESLVNQTCYVMVSALMKREVIEGVGLLDQDSEMLGCEDFDLWLRCAKSGARFVYNDVPLVYYRRREGSLSNAETRMYESRVRVLRKSKSKLPLSLAEQQAVDVAVENDIARRLYVEAKSRIAEGDIAAGIEKLYRANTVFRSRRIHLMLVLLALAPQLAQSAYTLRLRYLKVRTRKQSGISLPLRQNTEPRLGSQQLSAA